MWILGNNPLVVSHHFLSQIQQKFPESMRDVCSLAIRHLFLWENTFDFAILTASRVKLVEAPDMRNPFLEVITAMWTNLYTRFMSRMFSCCICVSQISRKLSVVSFKIQCTMLLVYLYSPLSFYMLPDDHQPAGFLSQIQWWISHPWTSSVDCVLQMIAMN